MTKPQSEDRPASYLILGGENHHDWEIQRSDLPPDGQTRFAGFQETKNVLMYRLMRRRNSFRKAINHVRRLKLADLDRPEGAVYLPRKIEEENAS